MRVLRPELSGSLPVRILDVSKDGLKVLVSRALDPGSLVQIRREDTVIIGEVRYSISVGEAHHAGVHIQEAFARKREDKH